MSSVKKWVILPFLLLTIHLLAQDSYQQVDSKSYQLYLDENWEDLAAYGNDASQNGFDYYYLNVRTGRAFFELKDFENAKNYFEKALKNNSASTFAKEYLFWSYYNLEQTNKAQEVFRSLPDSIQKRMDYKSARIIDYVYAEGGIKMANNKETAGDLLYGRFGLNHHLSGRFNVYHEYSYMQQKAIWGDMKQHQYALIPSFQLNKGWTISTPFNYSNYKSNLDYDETFSYVTRNSYNSDTGRFDIDTTTTQNYLFKGTYQQNALLSQININKQINNFSFTPHVSLYQVWSNPNYQKTINTTKDVRVIKVMFPPPFFYSKNQTERTDYNKKTTYQQWQYGFDLNYTIQKVITIGADINFIYHSDYSKWNIIPYMRANISDGFSLFAYFVKKGNYALSMFSGTQFLNTFDAINNKISITGEFKLAKKVGLFTTYQYESITDNLSLRDYQFNSLFIGLKIRP